ncbi:MAG: peptide-methionine (S)-S-oxide reductase [Bdellovibrionota bacterium]
MKKQRLVRAVFGYRAPYDKTKGVIKTEVGYSGGRSADASYKKVSQGTTGHLEVIQVTFDPKVISYAEIVDIF